jgi:uncharacterized membrane protein YeaQ/YmgE (transglycosylase-associated protein family)
LGDDPPGAADLVGLGSTPAKETNMGVVVLFVVGGVFGMAAETLERFEAQRRKFLRIVIGIAGLFGGLFLARELGDVLWSCGATAVALALFSLVIRTVARGR